MYIIQLTFLGWLSFASAGRFLGEECMSESDCFSQNCKPVCGSKDSVARCVEAKSFFKHLNIEENCVSELDAGILGRKVPGSTRELGDECINHGDCFSGNCVPICENGATSSLRCIEPVYSFSRHSKPIPTCISELASSDHLELHNNVSPDEAKPNEKKPSADLVSFKKNVEPVVPSEDIPFFDDSPIPDFIRRKNVGIQRKFPGNRDPIRNKQFSSNGLRKVVRVANPPVTDPSATSHDDHSLPQFILKRNRSPDAKEGLRSNPDVRSRNNHLDAFSIIDKKKATTPFKPVLPYAF